MKLKLLLPIVFAVFSLGKLAHAAVPDALTPLTPLTMKLKPSQQQALTANLSAELLTHYHYKAMPLDDDMSVKIFDQYIKTLDPEKIFFDQSDIDQLTNLRTSLDDAIFKQNLNAPFFIFNLYTYRTLERLSYAKSLLKDGFDFRQQENFQYTREKEPWAKSENEMKEIWRKRVKNDWLRLKLAGKKDKDIVATLEKRYENTRKRIGQLKSDDAFQAFMNAYTMAIEPHTNYMGPRAAAEFDISMRLSLVGIGAVLAEKEDYTVIRELVPGGPAATSGMLKVGDRILGVAQGRNGNMVDIQGWRLDDTVALIRGAADSTVVLDVLGATEGPDGKHEQIALVRKKITLEEQSARKSILSVKSGDANANAGNMRRIGVITLPGFYEDVDARQRGDKNYKSATRDVSKLLAELKQEKVDGVLIDLRNNGGGSLAEAIELTGLFTGRGPVVQTRNADGNVAIETDSTVDMAWDGPLGVLINRGSASASEIFAAAIQDYGRGLVIGESSFGKGTVQTMINLDQIAKSEKPKFGEIKLTIAQFFRIDGGTTQLRGVTPHISFPSAIDEETFGESSFDNALPWMQIKAADYSPTGDLKNLIPILAARHEARIRNDKGFICLQQGVADIKQLRDKNLISLNESDRRKERDVQEAKAAACDLEKTAGKSIRGGAAPKDKPVRDDGLLSDERNLTKELAAESARKNAKDVMLNEAANIIGDEASLLKSDGSVAAIQKPAGLSIANPGQRTN